jgi:hypothetical protein
VGTPSIADALGIRTGGEPWWREAACAGQPWSIFFHEKGSQRDASTVFDDRAKRICARCPVRRQCLEDAYQAEGVQETIARNQAKPQTRAGRPREKALPIGVYGGATAEERWAKDLVHLDDCPRTGCPECRPVADRIDLLAEQLSKQAPRFLRTTESITPLG